MTVKTTTRCPGPASWLAVILATAGISAAADFSLLSSALIISPAVTATNSQPRFTLQQVKIAQPLQHAPSDNGLATADVGRFSLTSVAGSIVLVQDPKLPQLVLQGQPGVWELAWTDPPLVQGLILESANALTAQTWQPVEVELTANGRRCVVPASLPGAPVRFYRLRKP
ncbi:MAG: hypothetical protein EBS05_12375 [Proteobacteria bacterium]|nr:hypothetical protein [Pseudomonadota bacterium]